MNGNENIYFFDEAGDFNIDALFRDDELPKKVEKVPEKPKRKQSKK